MSTLHIEDHPKHSRTSCADDNISNATADGFGCPRCTALLLDRLDRLQALMRRVMAFDSDPTLGEEIRAEMATWKEPQ